MGKRMAWSGVVGFPFRIRSVHLRGARANVTATYPGLAWGLHLRCGSRECRRSFCFSRLSDCAPPCAANAGESARISPLDRVFSRPNSIRRSVESSSVSADEHLTPQGQKKKARHATDQPAWPSERLRTLTFPARPQGWAAQGGGDPNLPASLRAFYLAF